MVWKECLRSPTADHFHWLGCCSYYFRFLTNFLEDLHTGSGSTKSWSDGKFDWYAMTRTSMYYLVGNDKSLFQIRGFVSCKWQAGNLTSKPITHCPEKNVLGSLIQKGGSFNRIWVFNFQVSLKYDLKPQQPSVFSPFNPISRRFLAVKSVFQ